MFIIILTIFFAISNAFAYCDANKGNPVYNCIPGQYIDPELNECVDCPEGYYCTGNGIAYCCNLNTSENFPKSNAGAKSINECYKDTANGGCVESDGETNIQCGLFYQSSTPKCWDNNGEYSTNYHTEPRSGENCYANTLACNTFNSNCDSAAQVQGNATYSSHGSSMSGVFGWHITDCTCPSAGFQDTTEHFCSGTGYNAQPSANIVTRATDNINYDTFSTYYCTRCILDDNNTKYYADINFSDGTQCSPDLSHGRVCKCETAPDKGYWLQGTCNSGTNWTDASDICQRVPCAAGQTTDTILPNDATECHYTNQTKFCDAKGCFSLTEAELIEWHLVP